MMNDVESLVSALAEEAGTVKPAPHPYLLTAKWIAAAAAYLLVSLALSGLRPDWARALQLPLYCAEIGALLLLFLASSVGAAVLSFPDLHQKRALASAPFAAFALLVGVLFLAWRADSPPAPLPVHSFECTLSITLVSILPALWTFHSMRRLASTHGRWAGSIAVLAAFSVGALWLRLHEVNDSIAHVVIWHYLPMLAAGSLGFGLGKRLLKW